MIMYKKAEFSAVWEPLCACAFSTLADGQEPQVYGVAYVYVE